MRLPFLFGIVGTVASLLSTFTAFAQERTIDDRLGVAGERQLHLVRESRQGRPPAPPLPWARASFRGPVRATETQLAALDGPGSPDDTTVILPLAAGLSIVSLPLRVTSDKLSELFPNLPEGSRAWVWDARHQKFVEGLDGELPLGHACWLYVPVPVLLVVTGRPNRLHDVSVDLEEGWNLIGVPYGTPLLRSQQHVYAHWARQPFNDAVAAGHVGPSIFSLDMRGYETIAEDGSFEPFHGYWVYAGGAELLELAQPGLSGVSAIAFPWGTVASAVGNMILTDMGYGDTAKLIQVLAKLDNISQTQAALDSKLDTVLQSIDVSKNEILKSIGDSTHVAPVQIALLSHYDQENPNTSLAWFVAQAKAGTGPSVSMATRSSFARQVLKDWDFIYEFNRIYGGIAPAVSAPGLLDNFANHVLLTSSDYDLKNHYTAMETYFNTLVGMQIKCATLVMNAYDQLANDPTSTDGFTSKTAANWKATVFDPVMKAETERFLNAVEALAVQKLPVPQTWSDPPVKVPDNVQVVLGLADLYVMEMLRQIYPQVEPPGVRMRIMLNPGAGSDLPTVVWGYPNQWFGGWTPAGGTTLPSSDRWEEYSGSRDYDDWTLSRDSSTRSFRVTKKWRMVRLILPVSDKGTVVVATPGGSPWWSHGDISSVSAGPTESGTLFGSITLAKRPTSRDVFDPCMGWPITTEVTGSCYLGDCARGGVDPNSCNRRYFHGVLLAPFFPDSSSTLTMTYQFTYKGDAPKTGAWKANGEGALVRDRDGCSNGRQFYELFTGTNPSTLLNSTEMDMRYSSTNHVQTIDKVTWEPERIYTFRVRVQLNVNNPCDFHWAYQGAQLTFPLTTP